MNENGNGIDTQEFRPPAKEVADLDEVEESERFLYVRQGDGYVLHPTVAAVVDRMERELQVAELEHRCEMLEIEKQTLTDRCSRLQREADSAAGRPVAQPEPPEPENSFSKQLAKLKSGLVH